MPISINGTGTITGISAGGLPSGIVTGDTISNGSISTVDIADGSITAQKLGYQNFNFRNRIINGDMRIDQRNNGSAVSWAANTSGYTIDRWKLVQNGSVTSTVQRSTNAPTGQGFTNSLLLTVSTAETAVGTGNKTLGYYYMLEGYNVSDLGWGTASAKTITISFWVLSNITGTFSFSVMNTSFSRSYNSSYTITTAGAWEKKTFTIAGDTGATSIDTTNGNAIQLVFDLGFSPMYETSTANTWLATGAYALAGCTKLSSTVGGVFYVAGVQLEAGSTATDFERRPIGTELALCQRYYEVLANDTEGVGITSFNYISTQHRHRWYFKATKRASPTVNIVSGSWVTATPTIYPSVDCCGFYNPSSLFSSNNAGGLYALAEL